MFAVIQHAARVMMGAAVAASVWAYRTVREYVSPSDEGGSGGSGF